VQPILAAPPAASATVEEQTAAGTREVGAVGMDVAAVAAGAAVVEVDAAAAVAAAAEVAKWEHY
jgi:hypothetical protein